MSKIFSTHSPMDTKEQPASPSTAASPFWALISKPSKETSGFSPLVAFCFTLNYIMGTGFLTIPWAFVQAGLAFSTIFMIACCVLADVAKDYILETMARAEAMLDPGMRWIKKNNSNPDGETHALLVYTPVMSKDERVEDDEETVELAEAAAADQLNYKTMISRKSENSLSGPNKAPSSVPNTASNTPQLDRSRLQGRRLVRKTKQKPSRYVVKNRKFEVNTLCRVFLGRASLKAYTIFISLYLYGVLWAYTSVFASAMARAAPIFSGGEESTNYACYAIIFGLVVVPMSCLELHEQIVVQVVLTLCRFLIVFLMVGTCWTCAEDVQIPQGEDRELEFDERFPAPMFRIEGIHKMLPIVVFATIYHHSIPGLSHPVGDKKKLGSIFRFTSVFCALMYSAIGFILGWAFGEKIEQSANLNWQGFHGNTGEVDENGIIIGVASWAKGVAIFVVCFPALDVLSAFPLNAITLGNNIMGAFHGKNVHQVESNRWLRIRFRLIASIPPVIGGLVVRELGVITDYAGTTGFAIAFCFPSLLFIFSKRLAKTKHFQTVTNYTSYGSSIWVAGFLCLFGAFMVVYVLTMLTVEPTS